MRRPISLSRVVRRLAKRTPKPGEVASQSSKRVGLYLAAGIFLVSMLVSACNSPFGGSTATTPTPSTRALNKISWCAKPLMVFRDEGAAVTATASPTTGTTATPTATSTVAATNTSSASGTPTAGVGTPQTVTDWSLVKTNLGFTTYLPSTLPSGSCLVSAQATIHDPIFGGNFTIGYLLPDHTSLSFSEAPLKSQAVTFQCNPTNSTTTPTTGGNSGTPVAATPSPTAEPSQLCSGAKNTTNIVLSGSGTVNHLQQIFNNLQPDTNWIPTS